MSQSIRPRRSALFVPADNQRALNKINPQLSADCIIIDMEDAVSVANKTSSREMLHKIMADIDTGGRQLLLRINSSGSFEYMQDVAVAASLPIDAVVLPKVEEAEQVQQLANSLPEDMRVWAMIETAKGVLNAANICRAHLKLEAMMVGTQDLGLDLQLRDNGSGSEIIEHCLLQCLLAARAGGLVAIDSVCPDFKNLDPLREQCRRAVGRGYDGKAAIHPAQLLPINACFSPNTGELGQAQAVIKAWNRANEEGKSVANLNGRMIEHLHVSQARMLLARAKEIAKLHGTPDV